MRSSSAILKKAGYDGNPLDDGTLASTIGGRGPITKLTQRGGRGHSGLKPRTPTAARTSSRSAWCTGCTARAARYDDRLDRARSSARHRSPPPTSARSGGGLQLRRDRRALPERYEVPPAKLPPGTYRNITGNEALALGLVAAGQLAGCRFLRQLPDHAGQRHPARAGEVQELRRATFQAEDEIAAVAATIGAAFGGALGVTGTSGPGIALKTEAHRPGHHDRAAGGDRRRAARRPQTGLPTKTEQADL
jgi:2-oxoglutarate ferredoxin oxidoreductase subunit alpha